MAQRALNRVQLIGNLTRDPELRYTPQGTAVCTFGLATNRSWVTETGDKKEEAEFHRLVAWNKLAEICSQLLFKGRRIFVEGRLQTRQWTGKDGVARQTTEIIVSDMIILDSKRSPGEVDETLPEEPAGISTTADASVAPAIEEKAVGMAGAVAGDDQAALVANDAKRKKVESKKTTAEEPETEEEADVKPEDIPF